MKKRNPLVVFLLGLITFGIYDLYWLVKTKEVLNQKTRHHTPTIWLLIIPYVILIAGYGLLFTSSDFTTDTTSPTQRPMITSFAPAPSTPFVTLASSPSGSGEEINKQGERRPAQYLHICRTVDRIEYVSQGTPKCLDGDTYIRDYDPSVAGTVYSSPCKTVSGTTRYVYISTDEACPAGTKLVFYNRITDTQQSPETISPNSNPYSPTTTDQSTTQIAHPARFFVALGLIFVGFLSSFPISIYWFFQFSKAVNEYTRGKMSTAVTFLILWLIHLIGVALIQDTFNEMEAEGPATPDVPMAPAAAAAASVAPAIQSVPGAGQAPVPSHDPQNIYPDPTSTSIPGVRPAGPTPTAPDPVPVPPTEHPAQEHSAEAQQTEMAVPPEPAPHPPVAQPEHHHPSATEHISRPRHGERQTPPPHRFIHPSQTQAKDQEDDDENFDAL